MEKKVKKIFLLIALLTILIGHTKAQTLGDIKSTLDSIHSEMFNVGTDTFSSVIPKVDTTLSNLDAEIATIDTAFILAGFSLDFKYIPHRHANADTLMIVRITNDVTYFGTVYSHPGGTPGGAPTGGSWTIRF